MSVPPTLRAFLAGMSGSGKSTAAWRLYLSRFPRRILLDQTGEWSDPARYPSGFGGADVIAQTVPELSWCLKKYAPTGKWTIVLELGLDDLPELVDYLIPIPRVELSPIYRCHGAVMLCDEVDLIAPPRSLRQEVRTLYRRSRHVGLSVVSTTQRPEAVSREVSAQSTQVLCLALIEPNAIDYMADLMGTELEGSLQTWTRKHPHGGLWLEKGTGRKLWMTEAGDMVRPAAEPPRVVSRAAESQASVTELVEPERAAPSELDDDDAAEPAAPLAS
jgi:hypothetical protein